MRWILLALVFLGGCDDELRYADGTPWEPVVPLEPGRVPPGQMNERDWARYVGESGILADRKVKKFTPAWIGFSADPVGDISYYDFGAIVVMWWDGSVSLTGASDTTGMSFTGIPEAIRPNGTRIVPCICRDNSTDDLLCSAVLNSGGGMAFNTGATNLAANRVELIGGFTATNDKGLTVGWLIQYPK